MWPARAVAVVCLGLGLLAAGAAFAQFNKCGAGFCPSGIFGRSFGDEGGVGVPSGCSPGSATGEMDFSICSNLAITAAAMP
jgi:hypothetical protein